MGRGLVAGSGIAISLVGAAGESVGGAGTTSLGEAAATTGLEAGTVTDVTVVELLGTEDPVFELPHPAVASTANAHIADPA
ncbi:hypothetical protein ACIP5Y_19480 [Nocardia sp. NPDC088792]|uniref:hypothetical protein n=1 Tax=Nocardia sp. NPDC088792 TaxID=3364332 RepID=UPI00381AED68